MKTNDAIAFAAVVIVVLILIFLLDRNNTRQHEYKKSFEADHAVQTASQSTGHKTMCTDPNPRSPTIAQRATYNPESFLAMEQAERNKQALQQPSEFDNMNFSEYLTNQVTDPTVRENHKKWVKDIGPWSGIAARNMDNMDEALEASVNFMGLRRPQAVKQYNQHQVTELDESSFSGNKKFVFNY